MKNFNQLAQAVAEQEQGKKEVSIAQIKEIIKILCVILYKNPFMVTKMITRGQKIVESK